MARNERRIQDFKNQREKENESRIKVLNSRQKLVDSKKVPVSIDAIYRERIGAYMPISINGEDITIPVDGSTVYVPEPFAVALREMLNQFNKEAMRGKKGWNGVDGDFYPTGPIPGVTGK